MDRKRATGPDSALPLVFAQPQQPQQPQQASSPKSPQAIRNFFVQTGVVDNANGSCYLEVDGTAIIVSVYGAKPIRGSSITTASFTVSSKLSPNVGDLANFKSYRFQQQQQRNAGANQQELEVDEISVDNDNDDDDDYLTTTSFARTQHSQLEQKLSTYIQQAFMPSVLLHKYPKSTIECFVNVLTNDQTSNNDLLSLITWAANCTALALVDSNLELKDIVSTGSAQLTSKSNDSNGNSNEIVIDPLYGSGSNDVEESARAVVSYMNTTDSIVGLLVDSQTELSDSVVSQLVNGCNTMAREIRANINGYLVNSLGG